MNTQHDHVMIDLETVDNVPTAAIVSIGAVDYNTGLALGLTSSQGALDWWAKQSAKARSVFQDPDMVTIHGALNAFGRFMYRMNDPRVWGNGASFDNAILQVAYRLAGTPLPWQFWNDRGYRTAAARIPQKRWNSGTLHNALDDAKSQAAHLLKYAPEAIV